MKIPRCAPDIAERPCTYYYNHLEININTFHTSIDMDIFYTNYSSFFSILEISFFNNDKSPSLLK